MLSWGEICCRGDFEWIHYKREYYGRVPRYKAMYEPSSVRRDLGVTYEEIALGIYHDAFLGLYGIAGAGRMAARLYGVSPTRFNNTLRWMGLWRREERVIGKRRRELVEGWAAAWCQCTKRAKYEPRKPKSRPIELEVVVTFPYPFSMRVTQDVCDCVFAELYHVCDVMSGYSLISSYEACAELLDALEEAGVVEESYCNEIHAPLPDILDVFHPFFMVDVHVQYFSMGGEAVGRYGVRGYEVVGREEFEVISRCLREFGEKWVRT